MKVTKQNKIMAALCLSVGLCWGHMNANDVLKRALKHADRREYLGKHAKHFPSCGTDQVQLINHFVTPAEWKCRHCKTKFIFEPDAT